VITFALAFALASAKTDIITSDIDPSVKPSVDFFQYANGTFFKKHPIPPSEITWGIANLVSDELSSRLKTVNEKAAKAHSRPNSDNQKIGDFWTTGLDIARADRLGLKPIQKQLNKIDAINSVQDALAQSFELQEIGVGVFFDLGIQQDEKRSDVMSLHISQGGLGLPNRDFYFNPEAGVAKVRNEYLKYIKNVLELGSDKTIANDAIRVVKLETALATASRKMEELRDAEHNYNKMPLSDVENKLDPTIHWAAEFSKWKFKPEEAVVGQPEFFTSLEKILSSTPISDLKAYMRFHLISKFSPYLTSKANRLNFDFYRHTLTGQKTPQPRWKQVLRAENASNGNILGRNFVKEYFPPSAKKRYSDLVDSFKVALGKRFDRLDWMSPMTKIKAHEKLDALGKKVGYPDKWKDYSALKVGRISYCDNMINAATWKFKDELSKFGKPVDRTEWEITPQTYNAYYNASNNEIVLPAAAFAIPGMKDSEIDDAMFFGNAGASWIGHEMTHGFDDDGRHYDAKGNLTDWWTKEDSEQFEKRARLIVDQFNAYEPIKGIHINGKASLGENIADYGGLLTGIDVFKASKVYRENKKIHGMTPMQRFLLAYNLSWLDEETIETLRQDLISDVHSPAKYRVNGPLSNIPDFYEAFGIKPGDPMWRPADKRPNIW
jgi:putative endopeptidase